MHQNIKVANTRYQVYKYGIENGGRVGDFCCISNFNKQIILLRVLAIPPISCNVESTPLRYVEFNCACYLPAIRVPWRII